MSDQLHNAAGEPIEDISILAAITSDGISGSSQASPKPTDFGRYTLLRSIGRGGFGEVFYALDSITWDGVAIKLLSRRHRASPAVRQRFELEIRIGRELNHPNIVRLIDDGEHQGIRYFVAPYVDGSDLLHRIGAKPMPIDVAVSVARRITDAVGHAHSRGYLHRDLKPANILVASPSGEPFVADFGLAKAVVGPPGVSNALDVLGTQPYMPPEQIDPILGDFSFATDIYAIGATMYQMLTGKAPFPIETKVRRDVIAQISYDQPVPPSSLNPQIPRDLERLCLICLEKSPHDRYPSAALLAADLRRFSEGEPIRGKLPSRGTRIIRRCQRHPVQTVLLIGLVIGGSMAGLLARHFAGQADEMGQQLAQVEPTIREAETRASEAEGRSVEAELDQASLEYITKIQEIEQHWDSGDITRVATLLAQTRPSDGEMDLRRLEWYYWDQKLQSVCLRFPGAKWPRGVSLSHDGSVMLVVTDGDATVWDITAGKRLFTKAIGPGWTKSHLYSSPRADWQRAAVSPDGLLFAATYPGPDGGSVRVWDRHGNEQMSVHDDDSISGKAITFSYDSNYLIVGGLGGGWRSWKTMAWAEESPYIYTLLGSEAANPELHPTTTVWFANERELHTFGNGIRAWHWGDETEWKRTDLAGWRRHSMSIDSREILGVTPGLEVVLPFQQTFGVRTKPIYPKREMDLRFESRVVSRQGEYVVAGCQDRMVRKWRVPTRNDERIKVMDEYRGCTSPISSVAMSSKRVAAACEDGTICIWPGAPEPWLAFGVPIFYGQSPEVPVNQLKGTSPSGRYVVTHDYEKAVGRICTRGGEVLVEFPTYATGSISHSKWSDSEDRVAIYCAESYLGLGFSPPDQPVKSKMILADLEDAKCITVAESNTRRFFEIDMLSHGGKYVAVKLGGTRDALDYGVAVYETDEGNQVYWQDAGARSFSFDVTGDRFAVVNQEDVSVWQTQSGNLIARHEVVAGSVQFGSLGETLYLSTGSNSYGAVCLDITTGDRYPIARDKMCVGRAVRSSYDDRLYVLKDRHMSVFDTRMLDEGPLVSIPWHGVYEHEAVAEVIDTQWKLWEQDAEHRDP